MKLLSILLLCLSCAQAFAFETDQYSLAPASLVDVGERISEWAYSAIVDVVKASRPRDDEEDLLNALMKKTAECNLGFADLNIAKAEGLCVSRYWQNILNEESTPTRRRIFTPIPSIYTKDSAPGLLHRFYDDDAPDHNYFWRAFSPTILMYGIEVGTDKVGHFMKLGREYYSEYRAALMKGVSYSEAEKRAVYNVGVKMEMGFFGNYVSGIYSNADLATNFAGLRFVESLFTPTRIHGQELVPLILKKPGGGWMMNPARGRDLLKPFVSIHFNEAYNPNLYLDKPKIPYLKMEIMKRCEQWRERFPGRDPAFYENLVQSLRTLDGVDYGHVVPPEGLYTIGRLCY